MSLLLLLLLSAQDVPLAPVTVPDVELAQQRGGFTLPNGVDIALTVQTQTSLDGAVVLRTVFRADRGPATLTVYAPRAGETVAAGRAAPPAATTASSTVSYDARTGILVTPANVSSLAVGARAGAVAAAEPGLAEVTGNVVTDAGAISRSARGGLQSTELRANDVTITHLAGVAFGSAIANSGSDRAIDTQTTVGIDISNAGAQLLATAALRIEDITVASVAVRP